MRESAEAKLLRLTQIEEALWAQGKRVAGIDEVGRGPLAGPVVTACVCIPKDKLVMGVDAAGFDGPFLVDAVTGLDLPGEIRSIVHGDALSYMIGAASIVAKVERDRYMVELDAQYPQYGFARNKGYGTAEHIAALKAYGPCPAHRRTFIGKILGGGV